MTRFDMSKFARHLSFAFCVVSVAGTAFAQTCYCCWYLMEYEDGSACSPGTIEVCEVGTYQTNPDVGHCPDFVGRSRFCYTYSPASGSNVIIAECDLDLPGYRQIGPHSASSDPPQCCYVDQQTHIDRIVTVQMGAGILNCALDCE